VTIQWVICGENPRLLDATLDTVLALDYPRAQLDLQICDDSPNAAEGARLAARARAAGLSVAQLRREGREGFKAGNLNHALKTATGELIAVLDADHQVPPDFLSKLVPYFEDERLAAVQARFRHRNAHSTALTLGMQAMYDAHFEVEQVARDAGGLWLEFNGSGGLWRRRALLEIGGWCSATGTEDVATSFLAQAQGWRVAWSRDVTGSADLVEDEGAFVRQQHRWAIGSGQVFRVLGATMLRGDGGLSAKRHAFAHIATYAMHVAICVACLLGPLILWLGGGHALAWAWLAYAAGTTLVAVRAQRSVGVTLAEAVASLTAAARLSCWLAPVCAPAFVEGLLGGGLEDWTPSHSRKKHSGLERAAKLRAVCALFAAAAIAIAMWRREWLAALPFIMWLPGLLEPHAGALKVLKPAPAHHGAR
jgi:hypothetical protein